MTLNFIQVENDKYNPFLIEIFSEYLEWVLLMCEKEFNVIYNIKQLVKEAVERSMEELDKYFPPEGRLIVCTDETRIVATVSMRKIGDKTAEIKRMYVQSLYRRKGIAKALLKRLIEEAQYIGYSKLRLDSGPFMKEALNLYRFFGFTEIEPYAESEVLQEGIPKEISQNKIFMEMLLK